MAAGAAGRCRPACLAELTLEKPDGFGDGILCRREMPAADFGPYETLQIIRQVDRHGVHSPLVPSLACQAFVANRIDAPPPTSCRLAHHEMLDYIALMLADFKPDFGRSMTAPVFVYPRTVG